MTGRTPRLGAPIVRSCGSCLDVAKCDRLLFLFRIWKKLAKRLLDSSINSSFVQPAGAGVKRLQRISQTPNPWTSSKLDSACVVFVRMGHRMSSKNKYLVPICSVNRFLKAASLATRRLRWTTRAPVGADPDSLSFASPCRKAWAPCIA